MMRCRQVFGRVGAQGLRLGGWLFSAWLIGIGQAWAFAQSPTVCPSPAQLPSASALLQLPHGLAPDRGLLWAVEKDGRRSWVYGTMHLGRADWLTLGPQLWQALLTSDVLALEVDLTDATTVAQLREPQPAGDLPPVTRRRVNQQLKAVCLPAQALDGSALHLQSAALVTLAARREGLYAEYGSERLLAVLAKARYKPVVAVEQPGDQMQLLKGESAQADLQQLHAALDELESGRVLRQLGELGEVWRRGDVARLARYSEWCDCIHSEEDRQAQRRLLDARNGPMADALERLHGQGKSVLLAVGALHLVGPDGLVALLMQRGFNVIHFPNQPSQSVLAH